MSIVLAALDTTPVARAVLETAIQIGRLTGTDVAAVHIRDALESVETPEKLRHGPWCRSGSSRDR